MGNRLFLASAASAALGAGLLALAAPASAQIHLDVAGYTRNYVVFADNDETSSAAAGDRLHDFTFMREMRLHFTGERTLDSSVTVGVRAGLKIGNESEDGSVNTLTSAARDPNQLDEAFMFLSGPFGEFRLGSQDGAAFVLQVAAPSADENVDGLRVWVQGWSADTWDDGIVNASLAPAGTSVRLDYDNADFGKTDRLLYLTREWGGFRAGVSYAPRNGQQAVDGAFGGMSVNDNPGQFEHITDVGLQWVGAMGPVRVRASAIHAGAQTELDAAAGARGSDDFSTWDLGLHLTWGKFSLGGALMGSNTGVSGPNNDVNIWVAGAAWDHEDWHLGASFYDFELEANAFGLGLADELHLQRMTVGGRYALAPGIHLTGTASLLDVDNGINSAIDPQQAQVIFGSEIWF